ncbi:MarR family winged helix-turn-helix transcriptional regulator [Sphingomonas sp. BLCC-B65]|nr:MarR family winged helix-turn-helix transcriptional regulator [Sphingomonas sp. BLCC-B65]
MELLGSFNDALTRMFDAVFETQWAEIEEILVVSAIACRPAVTTRDLTGMAQMNRRAMSRLVARLASRGLVETRRAPSDGRATMVVFTRAGHKAARRFRVAADDFLRISSDTAREICEGLGSGVQTSPEPSLDVMDLLVRVCQAGIALVRAMPAAASEGRLAARQRAALVLVASHGASRPRELPAALGVSRAGAAYIVDQLCEKGFVVRRRGSVPEDRRAVVLEVTADGAGAVHDVMAAIDAQRDRVAAVFGEIAVRQHATRSTA